MHPQPNEPASGNPGYAAQRRGLPVVPAPVATADGGEIPDGARTVRATREVGWAPTAWKMGGHR